MDSIVVVVRRNQIKTFINNNRTHAQESKGSGIIGEENPRDRVCCAPVDAVIIDLPESIQLTRIDQQQQGRRRYSPILYLILSLLSVGGGCSSNGWPQLFDDETTAGILFTKDSLGERVYELSNEKPEAKVR